MKSESQTPGWVDGLLNRLAPARVAEEIQGDLYELFLEDLKYYPLRRARRRYIFNALGFFTKRFFWKSESTQQLTPFSMLASYLKAAQRRLMFHKTNTVINIVGLVAGIAASLIIFISIRHELSFDTFHTKRDHIYRIVRVTGTDLSITDHSECRTGVSMPVPFALKQEISSFENIATVQYYGAAQIDIPDTNSKFREERGCVLVEPGFFKVFDFKGTGFRWINGSPEKSLTEPFSVVLTKSRAEKFFPNGNAMGKTVRFDRQVECKVTGIVEDFPSNTDFPFTILVSYSTILKLDARMDDWYSVSDDNQAYVVLPPGTSRIAVEKQIAKVHASHTPKDLNESRHYLLQPLGEVHFDGRFGNFNRRTISKQTIWSFGLIALFLLLAGCINYINLATAQAVTRAKEVGLRKVMGSRPGNLIWQFLFETFLVVTFAGISALIIAEMAFPSLQSLLNIQRDGLLVADPVVLIAICLVILLVTISSGLYPSLKLSRFNPATALKSHFTTEKLSGISLRKVLVVAQFTITQILVIGTFVVVKQMNFFRTKDMGFNREAVVNLPIPERERNPVKRREIENKLHTLAFVSGTSLSWTLPSGAKRNDWHNDIGRKDAKNRNDYQVFEAQPIDTSYLSLYQIKLLAGRNLLASDTNLNVLINKQLAKNLRLGSPQEAVGAELKLENHLVTVVGVIDNFYSNSLKSGFDNMLMLINPRMYSNVSVKLNLQGQTSMREKMNEIEKIWLSVFPEYVFEYQFFEDNVNAYYAQEEKYAQLFQLFSGVFMVIGCLGLFGLITFLVNRKSKEVAIRKVLGANLSHVLVMFSKEYIQLIAISFLVAVPVAYYIANDWLNNFAFHISLHPWLFLFPGLLVLLIAMLVVSSKSIVAANSSPVERLKYE